MSDEDSSVVGEILEQVITQAVSQEEIDFLVNTYSSSPLSLDYGDNDDRSDDFRENHTVENGDDGTINDGDIVMGDMMDDRSSADVDEITDEINEAPEYVVERIVQKKIEISGAVTYQVKWKNYPSSSNTWEPVENLGDCDKVLQQFEIRSAEKLADRHASEEDEQYQANHYSAARKKQRQQPREFEVNDVMGLTMVEDEKYFLVSLSNSTQKTFIRASLANRIIPQKVIDFYIKSMKWKSV